MKNPEVALKLLEIAELLSLEGSENAFRIRAYERAARTIEALSEPVEDVAARDGLREIHNIGQGMSDKITEYLATGRIAFLDELKAQFPQGIFEILAIPGMGPRRTGLLYKKLGITNLRELNEAAGAGRIRDLPGFGAKTEENILKGIVLREKASERILLPDALALAEAIVNELRTDPAVEAISAAGSLRRFRETVGDIDILCAVAQDAGERVIRRFTELPGARRVLAAGTTKASIVTAHGTQIDLRVIEPSGFGAALQYFTGSKEHNVRLRSLAKQKGFTVNEYGVFRRGNGGSPVASRTEEDMYAALGLPFIVPELREDRGEIEAALENRLPVLLERRDIRGDTHTHSNYSDGLNSVAEMAREAEQLGYEWVIITDHSRSLKVARGLSIELLRRKIRNIRELNETSRVRILCGTEVDILANGRLDYPDEVLEELDFVTASIHSGFRQNQEQLTRRIIRALEHPFVRCISHPTGRLLNRREPYAVDLDRVMAAAREHGKLLEINAYPDRLDLTDTACRKAKELGVRLAIGTDSHSAEGMENMAFGVAVARRGWLGKHDVVNTLGASELAGVLGKRSQSSRTHP